MAANPAAVTEVQERFPRVLTDQETAFAMVKLDDAWADLQRAVPDLADRITSGDAVLAQQAARVLAQAVVRVLLNPYGRKQESRGLDDSQRSWTLADTVADGELYFTDEELDSVRGDDSTVQRGKAFSVMPS